MSLAALFFAAPLLAQGSRCARCAAQSDSAFAAGSLAGSLAFAVEGLKRDSNDAQLLWRAARAELGLGIAARERATTDSAYVRSTRYARRAVALAPNNADMHYWLAAVLGRRALRARFRQGVPLARETYSAAGRAIALDSLHAGGHEVMGKLISEVRYLPWPVRKLAATMTGLEVARRASYESAEQHLLKSVRLDPTMVITRMDLSQVYLRMGRHDTATAVVVAMERMPLKTPVDSLFKLEARARLGWYK